MLHWTRSAVLLALHLGACERPLSDLCSSSRCPSFEQQVAELRARPHCIRAVQGTCGPLRYTEEYYGIGSYRYRWFGADGGLVAAVDETDVPAYCGGASWAQAWGPPPDCERRVTEWICPHPPDAGLPDGG